MRKQIYLHIGTHKTGTTSFQQLIRKNSNVLRDQGMYVPSVGPLESSRGVFQLHAGGLHQISSALKGKYNSDVIDAYIEAFENSGCAVACLSSEGFDSLGENELRKFGKLFSSYEIKVLLVLRHPLSLAKSTFCSRGWIPNSSNIQFLNNALNMRRFKYGHLVRAYTSLGGVVVIKYEDHKNITQELINNIGVDEGVFAGVESRIRQSLASYAAVANQQIYAGLGVKDKVYLNTIYPYLLEYSEQNNSDVPEFHAEQSRLMPFPEEAQVEFMNKWVRIVFETDCPIMQEERWASWRECKPMGSCVDDSTVDAFKEGFLNWLFSEKLDKKRVVL